MNNIIKTRFCPSPTGLVHLGNIRTALFNALYAKGHNGTFLLRIEDTDRERSKPEYTKFLQEDLTWLGLVWDEGPYFQSERQAIYDKFYQQLEDQQLAYPCFCSEEQLTLSRKIQRAQGNPPRYAGTCRNLSRAAVQEKLANGERAALRFKIDDKAVVKFKDIVKGEQIFYGKDMGDFIIRRTNGTPPFMFCNAVDDAMMGVTCVLRGEDHLTNTPRQLLILQALGLPAPKYGHISLIVGHDGSPLSKRHGSRSVQQLRQEGFLPLAVNNYLARLGHYYGEDNQLMSLEALAANFSLASLGNTPARFDEAQLLHWQKTVVLSLSKTEFWQWLSDTVSQYVPEEQQELFAAILQPNILFPEDALQWAKIFWGEEIDFTEEGRTILRQAGKEFFTTAITAVEQHGVDVKAVTNTIKNKLAVKGKQLFMPLRVGATGLTHGPELIAIFKLLGAEEIKKRFKKVLEII